MCLMRAHEGPLVVTVKHVETSSAIGPYMSLLAKKSDHGNLEYEISKVTEAMIWWRREV